MTYTSLMKQPATLVFFFIVFYVMLSACDLITQQEYEFYYYPSRNVYYDVARKEYIYSLDGGQTWDSSLAFTDKEPATLGAKQILHSQSPNIWLNNTQHLQQYNGQAINILINDTALRQDFVAERKLKKTTPAVTQKNEPEKKPGFFKRLFGKKNKDK